MPFGRLGKKRAAAGTIAQPLYMGLLVSTSPFSRSAEASASGYERQAVSFNAGVTPTFNATQAANAVFNFTEQSANIVGAFLTENETQEASDTLFQESLIAYGTTSALTSIANGSSVTVSNSQVRVS